MASHESGVVGEPARSTHCSIDRASCQSHQVPTDCFASLEGFETASAAKKESLKLATASDHTSLLCLSSKGQSKRHSNRLGFFLLLSCWLHHHLRRLLA